MDVPQVGGQLGEFPFGVEPGAIPADQGAGGESMTHILQPRTSAVTLGSRAEANSLGKFGERVSRYPFCDSATLLGDEKGRNESCGEEAISGFSVVLESPYCRRMDWHVTRFSELRPPDVKDAEFEVDIRPVQTQGFVDPHSCHHQQAKKGRIGAGAESLGGGELLRAAKKPFNLFVAVDVRWLAAVTMREKSYRGNLGAWVDGAMPDGKAPDHA
jgi:hypothetical protein